MTGMIYRLLWLALDEDPTLVPLRLDDGKMPTASAFCAEFQASRTSNAPANPKTLLVVYIIVLLSGWSTLDPLERW